MTVRPYPLEDFRKYSRPQADLSRALSVYVAGQASTTILESLGAIVGPLRATWLGINMIDVRAPAPTDAGWAASLRFPGGADGWIYVDPYLTHAWLTVGTHEVDAFANLSAVEHGRMSFLLLKALEPLAQASGAPTVSLARPRMADLQREWAKSGTMFELTWVVTSGDITGVVRLVLGGDAVRSLSPTASGPLFDVSMHFDVMLGTTTLSVETAASLAVKDILMFDTHGLGDDLGYLRIDSTYVFPVQIQAEDRWQITIAGAAMNDSETTELMSKALTKVEVRIGETTLSLRELGGLQAGAIIELDLNVGDPVTVTVQGKAIGTGELVDVDGRVGVRLLSRE